jgi:HD-GYP domain-containing protein (c-di-GMP phosphodiesterase class II)
MTLDHTAVGTAVPDAPELPSLEDLPSPDDLPSLEFNQPPPVARVAAPLRPLDSAWLKRWSAQLNPRHQPSVSGAAWVSALLRITPDAVTIPASASATHAPAADLSAPSAPVPAGTPAAGSFHAVGPRSMSGASTAVASASRRTAELLAALSTGLDAAERRTVGHAVRTAFITLRIAAELDLAEVTRSELLYAGLLRDAGSTGLSPEDAEEGALARPQAGLPFLARRMSRLRGERGATREAHLSPPDRAAAVVHAMGLPNGVAEAVYSVDERWDGRGYAHLKRDAIPHAARLVAVASAAAEAWAVRTARDRATMTLGHEPASHVAIARVLRLQRGHALDPMLVDVAIRIGEWGLWRDLGNRELTMALLELEPADHIRHSDDEHLDAMCGTFADLVDTRTPRMGRHGQRVADFAGRTGAELGFDALECRELRRAGLLHDIGKLMVPIEYLEKPGALTEHERKVVNEHPRAGAVVLRRSRALAGLAVLMVGHHERLDGEGDFPGFRDQRTALAARVIAVCDRYEAMTAARAYRPLLAPDQVWRLLDEAAVEPLSMRALRALKLVINQA